MKDLRHILKHQSVGSLYTSL